MNGYTPPMTSSEKETRVWCFQSVRLIWWLRICAWEAVSLKHRRHQHHILLTSNFVLYIEIPLFFINPNRQIIFSKTKTKRYGACDFSLRLRVYLPLQGLKIMNNSFVLFSVWTVEMNDAVSIEGETYDLEIYSVWPIEIVLNWLTNWTSPLTAEYWLANETVLIVHLTVNAIGEK